MLFRQKLTLALAFLTVTTCAEGDTLVYVVSAGLTGNGVFGTVDLNTGAYQQIGPAEPDGYFGLAPGPGGSLMSLTYASNLDSINPATGVPVKAGPTGLPGCVVPDPSCASTSGFALGGFEGKIYATDFRNDLYVVDPLTGAATLLSDHTGIAPFPFVPGTQNNDGTLNFVDQALWEANGKLYETYDAFIYDPNTFSVKSVVAAPELYQIDPSTGTATVIGATDLGIGGITDVNGTSYAFGDLSGQIETVNLQTGGTTAVGSFDPAAGVIQGAVAQVPEPGTVELAVIGLLVVLTRLTHRSIT